MERLSLEQVRAARPATWVDTEYGVQVGLKRISAQVLLDFQKFKGDGDTLVNPLDAYRMLIRSGVAEPEPTDEVMAWLESDWKAFFALGRQILEFNGLGKKEQAEAGSTFREGSDGPEQLPS